MWQNDNDAYGYNIDYNLFCSHNLIKYNYAISVTIQYYDCTYPSNLGGYVQLRDTDPHNR